MCRPLRHAASSDARIDPIVVRRTARAWRALAHCRWRVLVAHAAARRARSHQPVAARRRRRLDRGRHRRRDRCDACRLGARVRDPARRQTHRARAVHPYASRPRRPRRLAVPTRRRLVVDHHRRIFERPRNRRRPAGHRYRSADRALRAPWRRRATTRGDHRARQFLSQDGAERAACLSPHQRRRTRAHRRARLARAGRHRPFARARVLGVRSAQPRDLGRHAAAQDFDQCLGLGDRARVRSARVVPRIDHALPPSAYGHARIALAWPAVRRCACACRRIDRASRRASR